jgi:hypothetical protein
MATELVVDQDLADHMRSEQLMALSAQVVQGRPVVDMHQRQLTALLFFV